MQASRHRLLRSSHGYILLLLLRWRWHQPLCKPEVDQRLHGLDLLVPQQSEKFPNVDEVYEAGVKFLVRIDIPERIQPMAVVNVRVAPHHLTVYALDVTFEGLGEARRLAEPFTP